MATARNAGWSLWSRSVQTPSCDCCKNGVGISPSRWHNGAVSDYERMAKMIPRVDQHQDDPFKPGVHLEAVTPAETEAGGAGWTIAAGFADSPFGRCLIAESPRGICRLSFTEPKDGGTAWAELQAHWPRARLRRNDAMAAGLARRIFAHPTECGSGAAWGVLVRGTAFQLRVWRALLRVPAGALISYGKLAAAVGNPKAARAVGAAVGQNPVAWLIPCHRVVCETGALGGYRWGVARKRAMLAWESATQAR